MISTINFSSAYSMQQGIRISFHLPMTKPQDELACLNVINYLKSEHPESEAGSLPEPITGYTYTCTDPPVIGGFWWDEEANEGRGDWEPDEQVILFIDRPGLSISQPDTFRDQIDDIKEKIAGIYRQAGSPQKVIWCTIQPIFFSPIQSDDIFR
jgi:hypothetical protein